MRWLTVGLMALVSACGPQPPGDALDYRTSLDRPTKGLKLHTDGETGHAGMSGTNCPFETRMGQVTGDYDLPDSGESVKDVGPSLLGAGTVLLVLDETIHLLDKSNGRYKVGGEEVVGLVDSRFYFNGLVALTQDGVECAVEYLPVVQQPLSDALNDGTGRWAIPMSSCGPHIAFDVEAGTGWAVVGTGDETVIVDPSEGVSEGEAAGDLVVWDEVADTIYVATRYRSEVVALDAAGAIRWEVTLPGAVTALTDGGANAAAAVMIEQSDGKGAIVFLDGFSGEQLAWLDTPSSAAELDVSEDGTVLAAVTDDASHFYDVELD